MSPYIYICLSHPTFHAHYINLFCDFGLKSANVVSCFVKLVPVRWYTQRIGNGNFIRMLSRFSVRKKAKFGL